MVTEKDKFKYLYRFKIPAWSDDLIFYSIKCGIMLTSLKAERLYVQRQ